MRSFALPLLLLTAATTAGAVDFAKDIQPILEVNCVKCHGPDKAKGELRLDTKELTLQGGDAGPSVVAGKPDESPLWERVILPADHDDIMPPKGDPLTKPQQEALRAWIAEGAAWPDGVALVERDASFYEPDTKEIVSISVYPPDVTLETSRDHHRVVVVAKYADDTTKDVTEKAAFAIQNPELAKFEKLTFTPQQDGETKVAVSYREKTAEFPLVVKSAANDRPISFRLDVMPVFMRESCNTGSCHGSARGQDGFMLSLFGYDPAGDYYRLTRELSGRRINLARAEHADREVDRGGPLPGGKLFEKDLTLIIP
ncbi:MAG: c-type cytochrome domain-containing protein [Verrucomicrobiales bacterium]